MGDGFLMFRLCVSYLQTQQSLGLSPFGTAWILLHDVAGCLIPFSLYFICVVFVALYLCVGRCVCMHTPGVPVFIKKSWSKTGESCSFLTRP